ncbi:VOC family protein [Kiloniella laminariae]|uniref:2-oxoadipate dioxygenase/decarboxylase n=1 Tax=Kiloniella laminariae TaxID=454162 RepID=A0ABT4LFT0_9PROT|nr:VOC family protein [Kiloniella laminariae]MCZ4279949.1 VOC family protein [Kiloniella laminariae]
MSNDNIQSRSTFVPANEIRSQFSQAMSAMYREEVPAYGELMALVEEINATRLADDAQLRDQLDHSNGLDRITEERHGAIRVGTAAELNTLRRLFAVMGMEPVGYYDLAVAGIPVHSTAFRPVAEADLNINPFRVFTSLLRLELIEDAELRRAAEAVLAARDIFTPAARNLIDRAEAQGGLNEEDAARFVTEALETFRWHSKAIVDADLYQKLHDEHRLIADIVSFHGPHINHLTPRTLDIDAVQRAMPGRGINPKEVIEGPPERNCPILLRQTSFKALEEKVLFRTAEGTGWSEGSHTARFGEIEQRGIALTAKGRKLYDDLLEATRAAVRAGEGTYETLLLEKFRAFPDSYAELRAEGLAFFRYSLTDKGAELARSVGISGTLEGLLEIGLIRFDPIIYEDFLPVSAAGIFQSNLGDTGAEIVYANPSQSSFEADLGAKVHDELALYAELEQASFAACQALLSEKAQPAKASIDKADVAA